MKTVQITEQEIQLLNSIRNNTKLKEEAEAIQKQEEEKKWVIDEVSYWRGGFIGQRERSNTIRIKEGKMLVALGNLLKKWDKENLVRLEIRIETIDRFNSVYGRDADKKLELIRKYFPDFNKPELLGYETADFHLDFTGRPHLMRYIRKILQYNNDGIFRINIHEQWGQGYNGGVKALKLRGDQPFDSDYTIMSAKRYIEQVTWWANNKEYYMREKTKTKVKSKPELKELLATGTVKKVRWDESDNGFRVTFNNDSWLTIDENSINAPDRDVYKSHVHDSQPPVRPTTYNEFKALFLQQNLVE